MRPADYLGTAARDIVTQPLRCILTISAITLSGALLVTLVTLGVTTRGAIVNHITQGNTLSTIVVSANGAASGGLFSPKVQHASDSAQILSDGVVAELAALRHVTSASPQLALYQLRSLRLPGSSTPYLATAIATSGSSLRQSPLAAGTWFDNADTTAKVVVGDGYLRAVGITDPSSVIGQAVTFTTVAGYRGVGADIPLWSADSATREAFDRRTTTLTATIVGVTSPSAADNRVYLPMGWGRLVGSGRWSTPQAETVIDPLERNGYSNVVVVTDSEESVRSVSADITRLGFGAFTYEAQIAQIDQLARVMWLILGSIAVISLISASLGIINTLLMSVSEQKSTIRIWRSSGASRSLIAGLYLLQGIILSLVGATIGAGIGAAAYRVIADRIEIVLSGQGLGMLQLADAPAWIIGGSILVSVALAVLAAGYPARVASRRFVDA